MCVCVCMYTHTHIFQIFSLIGYYEILNIVPQLYSRPLLVIFFIYSLLIPNS